MSKANKFLTYFGAFMLVIVAVSCVNDDDYSVPDVSIETVDPSVLGTRTTFKSVVDKYLQAVADGDEIAVYDDDAPQYIEGYAVSSDQAGNFFEELVLQNKTDDSDPVDDPRLGLRIEINVRALSDTYDFGRKVYVKMNGLAVGVSNGVYTIGKPDGNDIGQIEEYEYVFDEDQEAFDTFILRGSEVATITPKVSAIADLTEADENTYIQLQDMQINRNQVGDTYAGAASDSFDGFRTLESCADGGSITLQTSTFADFKSLILPELSGSITGIVSRDFFDDITVFVINSVADVDMTGERCDPDFLECTGTADGTNDIFNENFEGFGGFGAEGWTSVNASGGNEEWGLDDFGGNNYAIANAFNSGEQGIKAWLVTPAINLDGSTGENLSFDVQTNFNSGNVLSAYITDNFTGDVTTTDWQILDAAIPEGSSNGFGNFETVGPINISCLDGDVHVAFLYEGSDPGATTRYHLDNVEVKGN